MEHQLGELTDLGDTEAERLLARCGRHLEKHKDKLRKLELETTTTKLQTGGGVGSSKIFVVVFL